MTRPYEFDDPAYDGFELFPSINIAETAENLIADRGLQEAAAHAAMVARTARAMKENEAAEDWDEVYRLIIARRGA